MEKIWTKLPSEMQESVLAFVIDFYSSEARQWQLWALEEILKRDSTVILNAMTRYNTLLPELAQAIRAKVIATLFIRKKVDKANKLVQCWVLPKCFKQVRQIGRTIFPYACFDAKQIALLQEKFSLDLSDWAVNGNLAFYNACTYNWLEAAQMLASQLKLTIQDVQEMCTHPLCGVCAQGHLPVLKWLYRTFSFHKDNFQSIRTEADPLLIATRKGHTEIVQWIIQTFHLGWGDVSWWDTYGKLHCVLQEACVSGHLHLVQWLLSSFDVPVDTRRMQSIFYETCVSGHLSIVQELMKFFSLSVLVKHIEIEQATLLAATAENLDLAKWLVSSFGLVPEKLQRYKVQVIELSAFIHRPGTAKGLEALKWVKQHFTLRQGNMEGTVMALLRHSRSLDSAGLPSSPGSAIQRGVDFKIMSLWIKQLGLTKKDVLHDLECAWCWCSPANVPAVKWLFEEFEITYQDFRQSQRALLSQVVYSKCLEAIQYIVERFGPKWTTTDFDLETNRALDVAYELGYRKGIIWLTNVQAKRLAAKPQHSLYHFVTICDHGYLGILRWFVKYFAITKDYPKLYVGHFRARGSFEYPVIKYLVDEFAIVPPKDLPAIRERYLTRMNRWLVFVQ